MIVQIVLILTAWFTLGAVVALVIGRVVRLREERSARPPRQERQRGRDAA